ncbi:Ubiquitin-conjugating enzyme suppressor 1 [Nakaseomyces glabratus]|uniref:Ubiquitin-conjugating enzyme suppressor 1 n=1 Tax=Candida glabrata TaxID=5478 RepID=A0A0W0CIA4_CANGB|nr:hypothetical protein J7298_02997 [Nakaseomyces glabratus]KAH7585972.1 hypothetical protein J7297_03001 [Nakaseomyces glabratus]KAH7590547.1 hypothetical protein J7296_02802 [Nakaseomyces glabratus]KAH7598120.1 hypothetical protein J7295_03004 [Nakaseomyces glabratus]KAH7612603.1 hypothetical protein J7292_02980 [Nakaseomyces glabratus]
MRIATRRLLREWKHYNRTVRQDEALFYMKPHDSNMFVWHVVLRDFKQTGHELYILLYLHQLENDNSIIVMKCLTPNNKLPINRNVSLTHLQNLLLLEHGFVKLIDHIWGMFFRTTDTLMNNNTQINSRLCYSWNRIVCKDFVRVFPELCGLLQEGDYDLVKSYRHKLNAIQSQNSSNCSTTKPMDDSFYFGFNKGIPPSNGLTHNFLACDSRPSHKHGGEIIEEMQSSLKRRRC